MTDLRDNHGFEGDTILFFDTNLLKNNLFREFTGEKFLPEVNLYCDLDTHGKMILINDVLYYCEYRADGLTAKYHNLLFKNPQGTADTYYKMSLMAKSVKNKLKYAIISQSYNKLLPHNLRQNYDESKWLLRLASLASPFFTRKYLNKFKQ